MMFLAIYFFILGLIVGSFLNVVIYRLPEEKSIIKPPSHCPHCNTRLKVIDLIPVLSFLITGAKCRYCGASISWQYPFVELLTGIFFLAAYLNFGLTAEFFLMLLLLSALIVISVIDYKYMIIPNVITYSGILIGFISAIIFDYLSIFDSLLGIVIPALILLAVALIFKGGMGMGDVKLVAMLGAFLGYKYSLMSIFIGSLVGSVIGLSLMGLGVIDRKDRIPFGPFICLGAVIMIFFGEQLIDLYFAIFL
ncbi:prepilin peptidase [Halanaerobium hydrogeniformans]|uniref:Prepilin leader peptidase/N-methyltransferase n=1 Tax=Halanaerobium hydrogeniformans TaxID=656519 RepID=E4RLF6_HALHG|nr:A24 family peptidase [Halanaerobium hydrogeniformans]ADQ14870.1 Prepilin peptidase [Halanaerobium hydrogeniformans]